MTGGFEDRVSVIGQENDLIEICKFRDFFTLVLLDNKELYFFSQTGTIVSFNEHYWVHHLCLIGTNRSCW